MCKQKLRTETFYRPNINSSTRLLPAVATVVLPGWEKPEMGCIMPVGGAPLAMGWGSGGWADETSGGDTPTGRGGRGSGGTPEMGGMGGMPGEQIRRNMNRNPSSIFL